MYSVYQTGMTLTWNSKQLKTPIEGTDHYNRLNSPPHAALQGLQTLTYSHTYQACSHLPVLQIP
jgi:hypothetical protein